MRIGLADHLPRTRGNDVAVRAASQLSSFAIFDGHGGSSRAAEYGAMHLIPHIVARPEFLAAMRDVAAHGMTSSQAAHGLLGGAEGSRQASLLRRAVVDGFLAVDAGLRDASASASSMLVGGERSGSTAVTVLVMPDYYVVGNAGDSRAVLVRQLTVLPLSRDHKPAAPGEAARIQAAGSKLTQKSPDAPVRIDRNLAVSRGLGDHEFKSKPGLPPQRQPVSAEPDVRIIRRNDITADTDCFLVLACDGVWDVMGNDDVGSFVRQLARQSAERARLGEAVGSVPQPSLAQEDVVRIAEALVDEALKRGSTDNITAMVVALPDALASGSSSSSGSTGTSDSESVVRPPPTAST